MLIKINIRRIFATGAFIVLPALITWFLVTFLFGKVNAHVTPHLRRIVALFPFYDDLPVWVESYLLPLLALVLTLTAVFFVGLLGTNYLGKRIINSFHRLMLRIPLVKGIYGAAKQLFDAFNVPGARAFEEVALIEFPRKGVYCLGFVTRSADGEVQAKTPEDVVFVFLPTTPNPTSGYLLIVPRAEMIPLSMTVEDGIKLIVSGGIVTPRLPGTSVEGLSVGEPAAAVEMKKPGS